MLRRSLSFLRRDFRRGGEAALNYHRTLDRIAEWSWPFWHEPAQPVPVHVLTSGAEWREAAWMLASWLHFSEHTWPLVIHDDGTLPAEATTTFQRLFPHARLISRKEADSTAGIALKAFPFCAEYRDKHPSALKLFDLPHFAAADRLLIFDSDLLFLNHPRELLAVIHSSPDACAFTEAPIEHALLTARDAFDDVGVRPWKRVDSGLCLLPKAALDLDFCDQALAHTSILRGSVPRAERTLLALCAARHGKGELLPARYEVAPKTPLGEDTAARHYAGATRDRFYSEGLKHLAGQLLPKDDPQQPA